MYLRTPVAAALDGVIDEAYYEELGIGLSLTQGALTILRAVLKVTDEGPWTD
jgi:hypothetical protein